MSTKTGISPPDEHPVSGRTHGLIAGTVVGLVAMFAYAFISVGGFALAQATPGHGHNHGHHGHGNSQGHNHGQAKGKSKSHGHGHAGGNGKGHHGHAHGHTNHGNSGGKGNSGGHGHGHKGGNHNPPGNNGTIKIDNMPFDNAPNNEPHVGCKFQVDFYGYDKGDLHASVLFEDHPPTADGGLTVTNGHNPSSVFIGEDDASGGGSEAGLDASRTYKLAFSGAPHPKQGYHVKVTIHADGSKGADTKHKVFWVQPCRSHRPPGHHHHHHHKPPPGHHHHHHHHHGTPPHHHSGPPSTPPSTTTTGVPPTAPPATPGGPGLKTGSGGWPANPGADFWIPAGALSLLTALGLGFWVFWRRQRGAHQ